MTGAAAPGGYDPRAHRLMEFGGLAPRFRDGGDTPRALLERCLEAICARESEIMAWECRDDAAARAAADAATRRYRAGRPLSPVDGLPVGIKDLIETADLPTTFGSPLYAGHRPLQDAACVHALREGGAVVVGKTVTVAFGGGDPARTRNPHDLRRTPGGSSSGSAAAVGAATIPAALGTHARGSTIRPASFCGAFALKPTFGALNRQGIFSAADSMDHLGIFAGSLSDVWTAARHVARRAGGDPGHPGLYGGAAPPKPRKPARLIRLETAGWPQTDVASKAAFDTEIAALRAAGVEVYGRADDPAIESYERALAEVPDLWRNLYRFEMRWPMLQLLARYPDRIPPRLKRGLEEGAGMTQETYREALVRRAHLRALHRELAARADGFATLSAPGPAPVGDDQGSAVFNEASSVLGAPAVSLPLLAVDGVPVGVQLLGPVHGDEALVACARWIAERSLGRPV